MALVASASLLLASVTLAPARPVAAAGCHPASVTGYSAEQFPGTTAMGLRTWPNVGSIVAAGPHWPLGSYVHVEGYGTYLVADRGHLGTYGVDILFATTAEALQHGRQTLMVCAT